MALVKDLVQRKNDVQSILQLNDLILTERIRLRVSIRVFTNRANIESPTWPYIVLSTTSSLPTTSTAPRTESIARFRWFSRRCFSTKVSAEALASSLVSEAIVCMAGGEQAS